MVVLNLVLLVVANTKFRIFSTAVARLDLVHLLLQFNFQISVQLYRVCILSYSCVHSSRHGVHGRTRVLKFSN